MASPAKAPLRVEIPSFRDHRTVPFQLGDAIITPSGRRAKMIGWLGDRLQLKYEDDGETVALGPALLAAMRNDQERQGTGDRGESEGGKGASAETSRRRDPS